MARTKVVKLKALVMPDYDEVVVSPSKRFKVDSGVVVLADPARLSDALPGLELVDVLKGIWRAQTQLITNTVAVEQQRVSYELLQEELANSLDPAHLASMVVELNRKAEFIATRCRYVEFIDFYHESYPDFQELLREMPLVVAVDSGMVGVFDKAEVPAITRPADGSNNSVDVDAFYTACHTRADNEYQLARFSFGAVTHSGIGDGAYPWYVAMNPEGKAIGIRIVFIETNPTDVVEDMTNEDDDEVEDLDE